jgi:hypothetical protein
MGFVKDVFKTVTDPITGKSIKENKKIADKAATENLARQTTAYDSIIGRLQSEEQLTDGSLQEYLNYINDPSLQNQVLQNSPEYLNYVKQASLLDTNGANNDLNAARANLTRSNLNFDRSVSDLSNLASSPQAQADLLANNPAFKQIIEMQQQEVLKNQAASGKLGSGDTLLELQRRSLPQGLEFVNNQISNYKSVVDANRDAVEANRGIINTNKNIVDQGSVNANNIFSNSRALISDRERQLGDMYNLNTGYNTSIDQYNLNKVGVQNDNTTGAANRRIDANQARQQQIQGLINTAAMAATGGMSGGATAGLGLLGGSAVPSNISPQAASYAAKNGQGGSGFISGLMSGMSGMARI